MAVNDPVVQLESIDPELWSQDTVTEERFLSFCWPRLAIIFQATLQLEPGQPFVVAIKQANLYRGVFRCVTSGHGRLLFDKVSELLIDFCQSVVLPDLNLHRTSPPGQYLEVFRRRLRQFAQSCLITQPMLEYMERTYLKAQLDSDWMTETDSIFRTHVVEHDTVRDILFENLRTIASAEPTAPGADPEALACIAQRLHRQNPHYVELAPTLFSRFIAPGWTYTDPECVTELTSRPTFVDPAGIPSNSHDFAQLTPSHLKRHQADSSDSEDDDDDLRHVGVTNGLLHERGPSTSSRTSKQFRHLSHDQLVSQPHRPR
eukprot:TRINITY_DN4536_c0_g1_i3.p1 TRINITY_DN4536_c0_g1~~TRINITY_DN4536_c0_g1_i3.p1  ORF type:complete len:317 (+),score=52.41 TRINITY_DN4536_c0_g1_i3:266-1216(+)